MINNFLCVAVKKYAFLERDTIVSPIKSQISNILIPNNFPQLKQLKFSQELTNKPLNQIAYPPPRGGKTGTYTRPVYDPRVPVTRLSYTQTRPV